MLQFAQSIWLWASAGVIVPIVIHLWNVRQGKTLKVGSIAFLPESAKSYATSLRLSQLLLLLLRCLLLIALAMLIAKPYYEKQFDQVKEKGWILIEKNRVEEVYNKFRPAIDSLLRAGYTLHYLNREFKAAQLEDVLKMPKDTVPQTGLSYWRLLTELDQKVPSGLPVDLFTDSRLSRFSGNRPKVAMHLTWHIYSPADTSAVWLEKAYLTSNDSIRIIVANSKTTGTYYTHQDISPHNTGSKFTLKKVTDKTFVNYNDTLGTTTNNTLEVDTTTRVIFIYTQKFEQDAHYIKAAVDAIKDFTERKMKVTVVKNVVDIPNNYDWLFWLSEETIPASKVKNKVFLYEKGKVQNVRSSILTEDEAALTFNEDISLTKLITNSSSGQPGFKTIWKNGFGEPVLNVESNKSLIYHFYSRFNPQWNDLTWSARFPQIIYNLIFPANNLEIVHQDDKRIMDQSQIAPVIAAGSTEIKKENLTEKKDLSKIFWLVAVVFFLSERMLSFRLKKEAAYE